MQRRPLHPRRRVALALLATVATACGPDPAPDTSWREAFDADDAGWLMHTWAPTPTTRYAVGGAPDAGVVLRDDGAGWAPVTTGHDAPLLNWIWGFGPDDLVVVGNDGVVLRYDGATWTRDPTPTDQDLWGVWGASPDDLWAVGGDARPDGVPTILRYDGSTWRDVPLPALEKPNVRALFKVWGSGPDDVLIVGQRGAVLRWDGATLTEHLVGASDDLIALWGTGPDRVVIVGGRGNAVVTVWDGATWETRNLAPLPGLNGVWMRDDATAHVVGTLGTVATLDVDTFTVTTTDLGIPHDLHALFGDASGRLTAVGGSFRQPFAPFRGVAIERVLGDDE